ncbi:MAG: hypothetical protein R2789_16315 [Microthrixaceae bacterium]
MSTTGFAGYQGQLSPTSAGAPDDLEELAVEVAGFEHQAYFAPPDGQQIDRAHVDGSRGPGGES